MYEDIYLLEPASTMLVKDYGKKLIKKTYWDYSNSFRNKITNNDKNISSNILDLLKASISRRMISDVPVGAFLSGGLDSSSVVAFQSSRSSSCTQLEPRNSTSVKLTNLTCSIRLTKSQG